MKNLFEEGYIYTLFKYYINIKIKIIKKITILFQYFNKFNDNYIYIYFIIMIQYKHNADV